MQLSEQRLHSQRCQALGYNCDYCMASSLRVQLVRHANDHALFSAGGDLPSVFQGLWFKVLLGNC